MGGLEKSRVQKGAKVHSEPMSLSSVCNVHNSPLLDGSKGLMKQMILLTAIREVLMEVTKKLLNLASLFLLGFGWLRGQRYSVV